MESKKLIIRLSSLGDIVLASSALEVKALERNVDWVISDEFAELIEGHPKINHLYRFNRKTGFSKWLSLCRILWKNQYTEVYDFHRSLRSSLMWMLFRYWSLLEGLPFPHWKVICKQRTRFYIYLILKKYLPLRFRPTPWVKRYTRSIGGTGDEKPNLTHLMKGQSLPVELLNLCETKKLKYLCVMPSSRWSSKTWPTENYLNALKKLPYLPVILGTRSDTQSLFLSQKLKEEAVVHFSGVGKWNLPQTALILAHSVGYLGGDTGLAHLAEAVGVKATLIFGPTTPDLGFGPWRLESKSVGLDLLCRPCGKDGRFCYRIHQKYQCLKGLSPESVLELIK